MNINRSLRYSWSGTEGSTGKTAPEPMSFIALSSWQHKLTLQQTEYIPIEIQKREILPRTSGYHFVLAPAALIAWKRSQFENGQ
jgi:hypothetical protein